MIAIKIFNLTFHLVGRLNLLLTLLKKRDTIVTERKLGGSINEYFKQENNFRNVKLFISVQLDAELAC